MKTILILAILVLVIIYIIKKLKNNTITTTTTKSPIETTTTTVDLNTNTTTVTTINNSSSCVKISEPLGWNSTPELACESPVDTYYGNNSSFDLTTIISANSECTPTLGGYYSNGIIWKYTSDGINFTSNGYCTQTTTKPPVYIWYITDGTTNGCGSEVGSTKYYSSTDNPTGISAFYTNESLLTKYQPGVGTIGWSAVSGPLTLAYFSGDIDINGDISSHKVC